jgi:hypothetical protein
MSIHPVRKKAGVKVKELVGLMKRKRLSINGRSSVEIWKKESPK